MRDKVGSIESDGTIDPVAYDGRVGSIESDGGLEG